MCVMIPVDTLHLSLSHAHAHEGEVMSDDQRDEIGNFQSCVFQIMAEEKYKRVRKLEKLIEKKKGEDRKRRVVEQQNRVRACTPVHHHSPAVVPSLLITTIAKPGAHAMRALVH